MFSTSVKQICNEYLIKFSENQSAPKLENRKTSPCSPCAPNLFHVLVSRIPGYHNLCSPVVAVADVGIGESVKTGLQQCENSFSQLIDFKIAYGAFALAILNDYFTGEPILVLTSDSNESSSAPTLQPVLNED